MLNRGMVEVGSQECEYLKWMPTLSMSSSLASRGRSVGVFLPSELGLRVGGGPCSASHTVASTWYSYITIGHSSQSEPLPLLSAFPHWKGVKREGL